MQNFKKTIVCTAIGSIFAGNTFAAGFSLYTEGSTVAVGNFGAGISAEAPDASTAWFNPAGLVLFSSPQAVLSGVGVFPNLKLTGESTFFTEGVPPYIQNFTDVQAAKNAFIPASFFVMPLGPNSAFGFSIVAPFGLATEYDVDSRLRYAATFTEIITIDISPSLAGKITENVSIGAGVDFQWGRVKFNNMLGSPATLQALQAAGLPFIPEDLDTLSYNKAHSFGLGFHAGIMGIFNNNHTRVGLNYQHYMKHSFKGESRFIGPLADPDPSLFNPFARFTTPHLFGNDIRLPSVTTLSVYHDVNDRLALLGSAVYTGWGVFKNIQLNNLAAFSSEVDSQVFVSGNAEQFYRSTWRFALGANYQVNEELRLRAGGGWDQTPTRDAYRDIRLPDNNRWALSIGAHYQYSPQIALDVGYTHLFAEDGIVNKTTQLGLESYYNVNATTKGSAEIVGVQVSYTMDHPVAKDMKP